MRRSACARYAARQAHADGFRRFLAGGLRPRLILDAPPSQMVDYHCTTFADFRHFCGASMLEQPLFRDISRHSLFRGVSLYAGAAFLLHGSPFK